MEPTVVPEPEPVLRGVSLLAVPATWTPPVRGSMDVPGLDSVQTATCGVVKVAAGPPEKIRQTTCDEVYLVGFSVEADLTETRILDMFRSYDLVDWRIHTSRGRVKHELSVVWNPYEWSRRDRDPTRRYDARHITKPLTVRACPDGNGMVLACSNRTCKTYADEDEVPPVRLPSQKVVLEAPWSYDEIQDLREGSVLTVPVAYHLRPGAEAFVGLGRIRKSSREFQITPINAHVRGRSGTTTFRIRAEPNAIVQQPIVEEFGIYIYWAGGALGGGGGCLVEPNRIRVRVRDR